MSARNTLITMAAKAVWNACWDHYQGTHEYEDGHTHAHGKAYWSKRVPLTKNQTIDSYIMDLVCPHVDNGLTSADTIAANVKNQLGL